MVLNQPKPSIDRICSRTTTGLAWIEPSGAVHWLDRKNTHGQWAYFYERPERDDGTWAPVEDTTTYNRLIDEGWIRVSNVLNLTVKDIDDVNPAAWDTWAMMFTECKKAPGFGPESSYVAVSSGRGGMHFNEITAADIVESFCSRRGKDAFWSSMMSESMVRRLVREMLLEDLKGFQQRTKGSDYMSSFDDPTFDQPYQKQLPHKTLAKDVKRAWAAEADHNFMKSLIKVHWLSGLDWEKKLDRFLSLGGNNEVSAMGYLPDSKKVRSSWGTVGVVIQGRVTLAANDMNAITSGYFKDIPEEVTSKYKSSGVPRRSTTFSSTANTYGYSSGGGSGAYILDRGSFDPERSRHNEFIVDNWKPIALVIDDEADFFLDAVRAAAKGTTRPIYLDYAKGMLKRGLPIYDMTMAPIDRKEIEKAIGGEG